MKYRIGSALFLAAALLLSAAGCGGTRAETGPSSDGGGLHGRAAVFI